MYLSVLALGIEENMNTAEINNKHDVEIALSLQEQEFEKSDFPCSSRLGTQISPLSQQPNCDATLIYPTLTLGDQSDEVLEERLGRVHSENIEPRVNSTLFFPEYAYLPDVVMPDRERLLLRLDQYSLVEKIVTGDGACQFRALSDQLYRTPLYHDVVRSKVLDQLKAHPDVYSMYVPAEYEEYCTEMAKLTTWGDHVTLKAAADAYGLQIKVLTSFVDKAFIKIEPKQCQSQRVLWLSFWAEVHYNSIYPKLEGVYVSSSPTGTAAMGAGKSSLPADTCTASSAAAAVTDAAKKPYYSGGNAMRDDNNCSQTSSAAVSNRGPNENNKHSIVHKLGSRLANVFKNGTQSNR
ncbi:hypothetical protein CEUSTIGMA_g8651.t1 [Chlamydomonas eustigma]|uniref:OTU domain-containing protein n=1 Tax=Chlamydomonas eustigma TaxID=1157962 RepID=A0A250XE82_9CHLO|nr:hypothetical protein CEUSTIGMA_g8651.t1 [Chlamydomonas eustigma]|eukprot:GAX81219.1 hypothetical protein CEUSTIGMA_g8651.t1 [Chlamydomonas eustigma]